MLPVKHGLDVRPTVSSEIKCPCELVANSCGKSLTKAKSINSDKYPDILTLKWRYSENATRRIIFIPLYFFFRMNSAAKVMNRRKTQKNYFPRKKTCQNILKECFLKANKPLFKRGEETESILWKLKTIFKHNLYADIPWDCFWIDLPASYYLSESEDFRQKVRPL